MHGQGNDGPKTAKSKHINRCHRPGADGQSLSGAVERVGLENAGMESNAERHSLCFQELL
jgi:hypothetical protein